MFSRPLNIDSQGIITFPGIMVDPHDLGYSVLLFPVAPIETLPVSSVSKPGFVIPTIPVYFCQMSFDSMMCLLLQ